MRKVLIWMAMVAAAPLVRMERHPVIVAPLPVPMSTPCAVVIYLHSYWHFYFAAATVVAVVAAAGRGCQPYSPAAEAPSW